LKEIEEIFIDYYTCKCCKKKYIRKEPPYLLRHFKQEHILCKDCSSFIINTLKVENEVGKKKVGVIADSREQFKDYVSNKKQADTIYYYLKDENTLCGLNLDEVVITVENIDKRVKKLYEFSKVNIKHK
jgi:hypothetical protein